MFNLFIIAIITILLTKVTFDLIFDFLQEGGLIAENYREQSIPYGYGLLYGLNFIFILVIGSLIGVYKFEISTRFIILVLTMTLIGIIDDVLGQKNFQGFKGHIKALICEHKLTTGFLKMTFSFIMVFYLFFEWYSDLSAALIATFLALLGANFINLLDVRPGRALKVVFFLSVIIFLLFQNDSLLLLLPIIIMVLFSLPVDLKSQGMMGDVGANILGGVLALILIINVSEFIQLIILLGLIIINLSAEFYSFTEYIAGNKVLSFIDELGKR